MHSSGVCAHPQGSGCASASYLGSQETPCQSRDSPFLWEHRRPGGNPATRPREERRQHCPQQCWMDRWTDGRTDGALAWGACWGTQSALARRGWDELGQGQSSRSTVQGRASEHGRRSQRCITPQQHPWRGCGGKEGPCPPQLHLRTQWGDSLPPRCPPWRAPITPPPAQPGMPPYPLWLPRLACPWPLLRWVVSMHAAAACSRGAAHEHVPEWAQLEGGQARLQRPD